MNAIRFRLGTSNIFGLPFAVAMVDPDDNDGFSAIAISIGPFSFSIEWRRD